MIAPGTMFFTSSRTEIFFSSLKSGEKPTSKLLNAFSFKETATLGEKEEFL